MGVDVEQIGDQVTDACVHELEERVRALEEERDRLMSQVARQSGSLATLRRTEKRQFKRIDRLERAIARHATGVCDDTSKEQCLTRLANLLSDWRLRDATKVR
jgi:chromosome segregation ATPase